jgi:hypothetical protein
MLSQKGHSLKKKLDVKSPEIMACYKLLEECVSFEYIEDEQYICRNLNLIKDYKKVISQEVYADVEAYIEETIKPIVYDFDYFDFLKKPEYGSYNEQGHFVINSDSSLEMMIFGMYHHTLSLKEKLLEMMSKYM